MALSNLDRELLEECLKKAPQGWENLSDRFLGLVVHVVHHTATMRNVSLTQELRDDLIADVFLSWLDKDFAILRRFRGKSSLATYLSVVSRRVVSRRMSQLRLPSQHISLHSMKIEPAAAETNSYTREQREEIEISLSKLSQMEATAVRMFHLEGKSYQDIGAHFGMSENSVGPFLTRAREKMHQASQ